MNEFLAQFAKALAAEMALQQPPPANLNQLLTVKEASEVLGIHQNVVRSLVHGGKLPRAEGIREMRISRRALEAYTAGRKQP